MREAISCQHRASTAGGGHGDRQQDAYDGPLSAIRSHVDDLGAWLGIWAHRYEPDAHARRCASDAVDAIDAMLRDLHGVRAQLVGEIRDSDDATAARADALLRSRREGEARWIASVGPWIVVAHRLPCTMCGAAQEPGARIRYDPEAGGLVCSRCGTEEPDGEPGILGQALGGQADGSL